MDESNGDYQGIDIHMEELNGLEYNTFPDRNRISFRTVICAWKDQYDIIVIPPLDSKDLKIDSLLCSIIAKLRKKKVALFWEKWTDERQFTSKKSCYKQKLQDRFTKFLSFFVDGFLAPGNATRGYYKKIGIRDEKCYLVKNASTVNESNGIINIREENHIPQKATVILYFGRIIELKGLDILIRAFEKIVREKEAYLLVCGDGDFKPKCEEYVKEKGIKNVIFTGMIQTDVRESYYRQSDIFVLPNRFLNQVDAWGLSVNEAMQFGKPVIVSEAIGAAYDLVFNGENGYIVEPGNVDSLYVALKKIIDENRISAMGKASLGIIQDYTYSNQAKLFVEAFKMIAT